MDQNAFMTEASATDGDVPRNRAPRGSQETARSMRRKLPPLNAVRVFEAVVRNGSFARAAAEFNVTPGAISRQLKGLEQFLGTKLYILTGRGFEPTPAARKFAAEVSTALDQIAAGAERLMEPSSGSVIQLDSSPAFALQWLIPRLQRFEETHPGTQVRLTTSGKSPSEFTRRYDLIIRRFPMDLPGYVCRPLVLDFGVPVGTPDLFASHPVVDPADLQRHALLSCDGHTGLWEEWMAKAGLPTDLALVRYDQFYTLMQVLLRGSGVGLGPVTLVAESLQNGQLVAPFFEPTVTFPPYFVLSRDEGGARTPVSDFVDWLIAEASAFELGIHGILRDSAKRNVRVLERS